VIVRLTASLASSSLLTKTNKKQKEGVSSSNNVNVKQQQKNFGNMKTKDQTGVKISSKRTQNEVSLDVGVWVTSPGNESSSQYSLVSNRRKSGK